MAKTKHRRAGVSKEVPRRLALCRMPTGHFHPLGAEASVLGAFQGSLTYRQFFVRGELPHDFRTVFAAQIADNAFKDIDPASEEERAIGWCSPKFALDVDLHQGHWLYNDHLVLGLRIDALKVPGPLLKLHTERVCRETMAEQGTDTLNRYQKAQIKENVKLELRSRMLPSVKSVDFVWTLSTGLLRFWSANDKLCVEFQELFERTFGLQLGADTPYTAAAFGRLGVDESVVERLATLEPMMLTGEG